MNRRPARSFLPHRNTTHSSRRKTTLCRNDDRELIRHTKGRRPFSPVTGNIDKTLRASMNRKRRRRRKTNVCVTPGSAHIVSISTPRGTGRQVLEESRTPTNNTNGRAIQQFISHHIWNPGNTLNEQTGHQNMRFK